MGTNKMELLNVIGKIEYTDDVLRDLILNHDIELLDVLNRIESDHFKINVKEENLDKIVEMNYVMPYISDNKVEEFRNKKQQIISLFDLGNFNLNISKEKFSVSENEINEFYYALEKMNSLNEDLTNLENELKKLEGYYNNIFRELDDFQIKIGDLRNMDYFEFKLGILKDSARMKLKSSYENIPAIIIHTGRVEEGEVYFAIYPKKVAVDIERTLKTLEFRELILPEEYNSTPKEISAVLTLKRNDILAKIAMKEKELDDLKSKHLNKAVDLIGKLDMMIKIERVKEKLAFSRKYFYLSAFVLSSDKENIQNSLSKYEAIYVDFDEEVVHSTKLKNSLLLRVLA
ncbi:hypothetical protein E4100_08855 [Soehngenia longivitae]|uniref:V-type ATP synthase subunit I n=1 Tax=Soehngenia longivitae TaxID=2562294 RepID=A0A4Z0D4F2_9FIRM|nr:hypothetical protein [Soehngenia longivitae]TFZ39204.1 hypothetical protein E4100_08855 [Soehngenia longivitae]